MVTAIAFDYGDARVGTATGNSIARLATPGVVLENGPDLVADAAALVAEQYATIVVVGLPRNMDGSEGPQAKRAEAFAEQLEAHCGHKVWLQDETLSTVEAGEQFPGAPIDAAAAAVILERFFHEQAETYKPEGDLT